MSTYLLRVGLSLKLALLLSLGINVDLSVGISLSVELSLSVDLSLGVSLGIELEESGSRDGDSGGRGGRGSVHALRVVGVGQVGLLGEERRVTRKTEALQHELVLRGAETAVVEAAFLLLGEEVAPLADERVNSVAVGQVQVAAL